MTGLFSLLLIALVHSDCEWYEYCDEGLCVRKHGCREPLALLGGHSISRRYSLLFADRQDGIDLEYTYTLRRECGNQMVVTRKQYPVLNGVRSLDCPEQVYVDVYVMVDQDETDHKWKVSFHDLMVETDRERFGLDEETKLRVNTDDFLTGSTFLIKNVFAASNINGVYIGCDLKYE